MADLVSRVMGVAASGIRDPLLPLLPVRWRRQVLYGFSQHRWGDFSDPTTFSEKINWRIIHDRRPLLRDTCDKLRMKELATRVGVSVPETLWSGTDLGELTSVRLPSRWVLKANHSSGRIHFGQGEVRNPRPLIKATRAWLRPSLPARFGEWAYLNARPLFVLEEDLSRGGQAPVDYKFFVFADQVPLIVVESDRYSNHVRRFYRPPWEPLEAQLAHVGWSTVLRPLAKVMASPPTLAAMLDAALKLGRGFDFMRVDLYSVDDQVYAGELTPYPGGGLPRFVPRSLDEELGSYWELPPF